MIDTLIFDLGGIAVPEKWNEIKEKMREFVIVSPSRLELLASELRSKLVTGELSLIDFYSELLGGRTDITPSQAVAEHIRLHKAIATERDQQIMNLVRTLREKGYNVDCATNTEREIAEYVKRSEDPIFNHFGRAYISTEIGVSKENPEFWKVLADPKKALLIDNEQRYLDAARKVGLHTILYGSYKESYPQLLKDLRRFTIKV